MKKAIIRAILCCSLLLMCGCKHMFETGTFYESYISKYYITASQTANLGSSFTKGYIDIPVVLYASRGETSEELGVRYKELSTRYGDTNFNSWVSYPSFRPCSWAFPFSKFTIVSDADFDEDHLAGTPLDDIVNIIYTTHKPFVENNYKHVDIRRSSNDYSGYKETKRLSELTPEDAIFMEPKSILLGFPVNPTIAQTHHFTVTIHLEGQEPYSFELDADFSSAESND